MGFLCIDIGGTNTLVGVGNGEFKVVEKYSSKQFLKDISSHIDQIIEETDTVIEKVAVAAAGPMNKSEGVFYPPNMAIEKVNITEPLQRYGDVSIINDCTSAVLGEYHYGEHNCDDLVYVTISSGIGAGVVLHGNLIEGSDGNFGEVGHMKIADNGVSCGCGAKGHWEAYCSGNNLPKMAEKLTGKRFEDAREVFDKYREGCEDATKTIEKMKDYNARGFANLVNLYNPEKIVVGGAVALNHPDLVVEGLEEEVDVKTVNRSPKIETTSLEEQSVLHGLRAVCNGEA